MQIAILEGDFLLGRLLVSQLEAQGYETFVLKQPAQIGDRPALDYDMLILDLTGRDLDEVSLIAKLRDIGRTLPILVLNSRRMVDGLQFGAVEYLSMPFTRTSFQSCVERLLRWPARRR